MKREHVTGEAGLLAHVERLEHGVRLGRIDAVRAASADRSLDRDEGDDATGRLGDAAMIGGALPEAALEAADEGAPALEEAKRRAKNQRAVTEDPHRFAACLEDTILAAKHGQDILDDAASCLARDHARAVAQHERRDPDACSA